jgi:hypothetical protein
MSATGYHRELFEYVAVPIGRRSMDLRIELASLGVIVIGVLNILVL